MSSQDPVLDSLQEQIKNSYVKSKYVIHQMWTDILFSDR